jgi:hypothetical protein
MIDPYHSGRREVTRTAARMIQTKPETWEGSIKTELDADGTYRVFTGGRRARLKSASTCASTLMKPITAWSPNSSADGVGLDAPTVDRFSCVCCS